VNQEALVLAQGDGWVAAAKPEGMATVPECRDDPDCLRAVLERRLGCPLLPVHRLDKDVSGIVLFATGPDRHRELCIAFERRRVAKRYRALVAGRVSPEEGRIDLPLREFGSGRVAADPVRGKPSLTAYRAIERLPGHTLLEVAPLTGRRHQIRAHLCSIGHPIAGDSRYGGRTGATAAPRLMLHADGVEVTLPDGTRIAPPDCPSATFEAVLEGLRRSAAVQHEEGPLQQHRETGQQERRADKPR